MSQGFLGFQYEIEKKAGGLTALAGLPAYLEFAHVMGLMGHIRSHLEIKDDDDGWSGDRIIMALVLLNLAGGDCVDDLRILESDEGFAEYLGT